MLSVGGGCNMFSSVVFATYRVSKFGEAFLALGGEEVMLPVIEKEEHSKAGKTTPVVHPVCV